MSMRPPMARRERRQIAALFAAPLLVLALICARQLPWSAPRFPVPPGTQVLECRSSPLARLGGAKYVQRVQSPLAPAQFWARTRPLLQAQGLKPDVFHDFPNSNQGEVRDSMQRSFRKYGLTQIVSSKMGCLWSGGTIDGNHYNVYLWPHQNGTVAEFWIR